MPDGNLHLAIHNTQRFSPSKSDNKFPLDTRFSAQIEVVIAKGSGMIIGWTIKASKAQVINSHQADTTNRLFGRFFLSCRSVLNFSCFCVTKQFMQTSTSQLEAIPRVSSPERERERADCSRAYIGSLVSFHHFRCHRNY